MRVRTDFDGDENTQAVGYDEPAGEDKLALKQRQSSAPGPGFHLAFSAPSREAVNQFYEAAISHGGTDNGAPRHRPDYGSNYYAAYIIDLDGYRIEAVTNVEFFL